MKKFGFAIMATLFACISLRAQTYRVQAGLTVTNLKHRVADNFGSFYDKSRTGYYLQASASWTLKKQLFIAPSLMYVQKGALYESPTVGPGGTPFTIYNYYRYHFLEIPVHLGWAVSNRFRLSAGPQFSYCIGASNTSRFGSPDAAGDTHSIYDNMQGKLQLGMSAEAALRIYKNLELAAGYSGDLTRMDTEYRNHVYKIGLQFAFR